MSQSKFEMPDIHQKVIQTSGLYLLGNITPSEKMWTALTRLDVLSPDVVQDIKACPTIQEQIAKLLVMLSSRGPEAFDTFCGVMLEHDHVHVAEYLITEEVACHLMHVVETSTSQTLQGQLLKSFRRHAPKLQRWAKRKFEQILDQQQINEDEKANTIKDLKRQLRLLYTEVSDLKQFINRCKGIFQNISREFETNFSSGMFLQQERSSLEKLKVSFEENQSADEIKQFCNGFQDILSHLEHFTNENFDDPSNDDPFILINDDANWSMCDKIEGFRNKLASLANEMKAKSKVPGRVVADGMETLCERFVNLAGEIENTKIKQKQEMETEVLSLLINFKEKDRLLRELQEKHSHIEELYDKIQTIKKKSKNHKKFTQKLEENLSKLRKDAKELEKMLEERIKSGEKRHVTLWKLLPDYTPEHLSTTTTPETDSENALSRDTSNLRSVMPEGPILLPGTECHTASSTQAPEFDHGTVITYDDMQTKREMKHMNSEDQKSSIDNNSTKDKASHCPNPISDTLVSHFQILPDNVEDQRCEEYRKKNMALDQESKIQEKYEGCERNNDVAAAPTASDDDDHHHYDHLDGTDLTTVNETPKKVVPKQRSSKHDGTGKQNSRKSNNGLQSTYHKQDSRTSHTEMNETTHKNHKTLKQDMRPPYRRSIENILNSTKKVSPSLGKRLTHKQHTETTKPGKCVRETLKTNKVEPNLGVCLFQ